MRFDPANLAPEAVEFLTERHLGVLSINRPGRPPHATPVGVTFDTDLGVARVITWAASVKARLVEASPDIPVAVSQVDGGRWLTLYGTAHLSTTQEEIRIAETRYAARYRPPKSRTDRVVIVISVDSIVGRA